MSNNDRKKIGSVLVVGGGIGGMQSSLDLAEAGYKVYLVEKNPAIGGVMAQLDKTFPTNDCAMCTLAPRLVDAGGHLNIEKITDADIESFTGEPGNFEVTLNKRARYIDMDLCTGCGLCAEKCPVALNSEFDMELIKRTAIYRRYPQAVPGTFSIDKQGVSPCRIECPAGVNAHAYVSLIARGRFAEALEIERKNNPFPGIIGRICTHPCEGGCTRNELDEAVSICGLKRFLADWEIKNPDKKAPPPVIKDKTNKKAAVIGSGPAGLMAARELALCGHEVTIFEAQPDAGGMLRYGIPSFRLPRDILKAEIQSAVLDLGVTLKTNTRLGRDITIDGLKKQGFEAVFLGIGAWKGMSLDIPGEKEYTGVIEAIGFLLDLNLGKMNGNDLAGKKAVIIGGGNVAIDAARTAWRYGADVTIVYRRTRNEMPAIPGEIEDAIREGVKITYLAAPVKVTGKDGRVTGIECVKMKLGEPDSSGRARPVPVPGSNYAMEADILIPAISQRLDTASLSEADGFRYDKRGALEVEEISLGTTAPGIFAGGDAVTGPATAVEAIESGRRAAVSIDRFLRGKDITADRGKPVRIKAVKDISGSAKKSRVRTQTIPVSRPAGNFDEVERGYTEEEAVEEASRCLSCSGCCECLICEVVCEAKAVDHLMEKEEKRTISVGAAILAPGFQLYDAGLKKEFGFDRYPNVLSSLQFERVLSASGPFQGQILRPSDGKHPKNIAFIQCVGSREVDHDYCSAVCCMYATKEAIIAKEHQSGLECHIFYIDIRAYGKGYEQYYKRARELGVTYTRCKPSEIREDPSSRSLKLTYFDETYRAYEREFDMVVLSCGLTPPSSAGHIAETFQVDMNRHGFCQTSRFAPVETSRPGVFACGPFIEPKDIPETVMEASGAASKAMTLLAGVRGTLAARREYPPELDVAGQEPRIGVFVCHCGKNIGGVADVPSIRDYAAALPGVVYADDNLYTCSTDTQKKIKDMIKEHGLNRVVVASCTPRTHEPLFRNTCREAGLNPYLFEMANIRDQNTWVHMAEPAKATEKAKDLVRIAVAKARVLEPLRNRLLDVEHDALVIGGGYGGMTAALELADKGFTTHLVERSGVLGGNMRHVYYVLDENFDPQKELETLIRTVTNHEKIRLHLSSEINEVAGSIGNFETTLATPGGEIKFRHGAVILATGGSEYRPEEYRYGEDPRVITQVLFEEYIARKTHRVQNADGRSFEKIPDNASSVVMIQCVGSRDEKRPYCSRICCAGAIKNALAFKKMNPPGEVYVLYRDVRAYGFNEEYYTKARDRGVKFIRYDENDKPEVSGNDGKLRVTVNSPVLAAKLEIEADLVVLSAGTVFEEGNEALAQKLKVPLNQDHFFLEAHMKLRPVDFATDGVFLCGLAHSPKTITESISQACAAASRAATILSKDRIELDAVASNIIDDKCDGCAYCVDPCPFKALTLIEYVRDNGIKKTIDRNLALCKGCGVCQATCPKGGVEIMHFKLPQLMEMVHAALNI